MANEQKKEKGQITLMSEPTFNLDDMDPKFCMVSLNYTGCFCLRSTKTIDVSRPGMVDINGKPTEAPIIEKPNYMFGQMVGIRLRKFLREYGKEYKIRYYGAFDTDGEEIPPFDFVVKTLPKTQPGQRYPEHDNVVLQAAHEGMVLLKNERNTLPLPQGSVVNVFGKGTVVFRSGCLGAGKINPRYALRIEDGLKYTSLRLNEELYEFYRGEKDEMPNQPVIERAKKLSDTAFVFITRCSSEAHEMPLAKGGYYLTDEERALIKHCSEQFEKCVVILNTAYPIEMKWKDECNVSAILWTGLCGMAGGRALAEILEGKVSPSGKLPNTWAYDYYDYPSAANFLTKEDIIKEYGSLSVKYSAVAYEEGIYVGYRYFTTFEKRAAYLFGHGLSYTTFTMQESDVKLDEDLNATVKVCVTNTGKVAGKQVIAIYAKVEGENIEQPVARLVAFAKTKTLQAGESEEVLLKIPCNRFASYSEKTYSWVIERGSVTLLLGGTVEDAQRICSFDTKYVVVKESRNLFSVPVQLNELSQNKKYVPSGITRAYKKEELACIPHKRKHDYSETDGEAEEYHGKLITFDDVVKDRSLLDKFIAQMNEYQLARLCVGGKTGWGVGDKGNAGSLERGGELEKFHLPEYLFSDGNNGVNVNEVNIGFPTSNVMCASWNAELMRMEGRAIAKEAKDMGMSCLLAPSLNIQRNPLCGRHSEYFSEDPLLAGVMSGSQACGIEEMGVSACIKHFFANNCELMRSDSNSIMSDRCAREIYLKAFEYSFETYMPDTVMTSYNAVNGVYCSNDEVLLRDYLRGELGFNGFVMTDWNGYGDEGFTACLKAGVSWLAPGSPDDTIVTPIVEDMKCGKLSKKLMQENAKEIMKVILRRKYLHS